MAQQPRNRQSFGNTRASSMHGTDLPAALQVRSYEDRLARPIVPHDISAPAHEGLRMAAIREAAGARSARMPVLIHGLYVPPDAFARTAPVAESHELQLQEHLGFGGDLVSPGQQRQWHRGNGFLLPPRGSAGVGIAMQDEPDLSVAASWASETLSQGSSAGNHPYGLGSVPAPPDESDTYAFDSGVGQSDAPQWGNLSSLQTPFNGAEFISPPFDFSSIMPDLDIDSMQASADGQASSQFGYNAIAQYNAQQQACIDPWSVFNGMEQSARFPTAGFEPHLDLPLSFEPGYVAVLPEQPCENFEAEPGLDNAQFIEENIGINNSNQSNPNRHRKGVRTRAMGTVGRAKAAAMRKKKACMRCRRQRVACDMNDPCNRCRGHTLSSIICFRGQLNTHVNLLYQEPLARRDGEAALEDLITQTVGGFTSNCFVVEMTSGDLYPVMQFYVQLYSPRGPKALEYLVVDSNEHDPQPRFCSSYAVPVILAGRDTNGRVVDQLTRHARLILNGDRNRGESQECPYGDTADLPFQLFEAVNQYRKDSAAGGQANKHLLDACMFHTMQSIIARVVPMTKESINMTLSRITKPEELRFVPAVTSKIVDAQIVCVMQRILHVKVNNLLNDLERILRARGRSITAWLDSFCIVIVLVSEPSEIPVSPTARASYWRHLEERLYTPCVSLFHERFGSPRSDAKDLNLLRDGLRLDDGPGVTQSKVDFVNRVRRIVAAQREDMLQRAQDPIFGKCEDPVADNMALRSRNSGRLVAKFLLSFEL